MKSKEYLAKDIMLNQLAYYEREENELIDSLYDVLGDEIEDLLHKINDLYKQLNVDTATWGLDIWESNLDINISDNLSYEERRAIIKTKLKAFGKISTGVLESAVQDYYNNKVNVYFNHKLLFEIPLESEDPKLLDRVIYVINKLKPAHLGYDIQLYLKPIITGFSLQSISLFGEDVSIYPSIAKDPEIYPQLYVGAYYDGISEIVILNNFEEHDKINMDLDVRNIGNLINQLEQITLYSDKGGGEDV